MLIDDQIFEDECEAYGLTEEEREDCIESGLTPSEWVEENTPDEYDEFEE